MKYFILGQNRLPLTSRFNPECNTKRGFKNQLYIELGPNDCKYVNGSEFIQLKVVGAKKSGKIQKPKDTHACQFVSY